MRKRKITYIWRVYWERYWLLGQNTFHTKAEAERFIKANRSRVLFKVRGLRKLRKTKDDIVPKLQSLIPRLLGD